ncbi:MAG: hypothetical protein ABJG55_12170 [Paracoccaceae bacterium]
MRAPFIWVVGLAASIGLHAGGAVLFLVTNTLREPPTQTGPESRFKLETVTPPTEDAQAQVPEGQNADATQPQGTALDAGAIPQSTAAPLTPSPEVATDSASQITQTIKSDVTTDTIAPAQDLANEVETTTAIAPPNTTVATAAPSTVQTTKALTSTDVQAITATQETLASVTATLAPTILPQNTATRPVSTQQPAITSNPAPTTLIAQEQPAPKPAQQVSAKGAETASFQPQTQAAKQPDLPATQTKADTAWQFGERLVTDPKALATIQAFMAPSQTDNADQVKDNLISVLTQTDCARVSATFLPETGTLEMQGHIPDPALRDGIVAELQAQVGDGIEVTANLLHLPSPQCNALTGISNVGLPQSTDQFTDDRLIGSSPHAREYTYSAGQRLQFDLVAPDYDAVIYVDYFAADGTVIHLVPNEHVALEISQAKSLIGVGTDEPGQPGLKITIGPPYGQEIAVAFAASHPLYDGLRPIVEPAEPYLTDLKNRITNARAEHADFKGEWVYFFITTQAAVQ